MSKVKESKDRYIISLQASSIMRAMDTNGEVISKPSMYTGVFPYSLEMIALEKFAPRTFATIGIKKVLTSIINVQFDNSYYEYISEDKKGNKVSSYKAKKKRGNITVSKSNTKRGKKIMGISQLRKKLYNDGFILDGAEYVEYKRSGSKAKDGNHLFILKDLHYFMQYYSRLGIQFPTDETEEFDLTSAKAYESLVGSAIEYTLDIKPEEILIVRDIKNTFKATVNMVAMKDGELVSKITDDYDMTNDCFDGESLLDSSLFPIDEDGKQKGFQLLRSNYLKSASFNTNLQEFFTHTNTTTVYSMFGKPQDASKVKLVITPNSLKIFKFKQYINVEGKRPEEITDEDAYNYWLRMIDTTFGVVKSEHISNLGNGLYNVMSYQMLNSIPLTLPDVKKVLETDFNYIKDVKNHISVFRDMIKNNKISSSGDIVTNLLCFNDEFMKVDLAKELRSDITSNYKDAMKGGKISVQGDYGTICSMPWEFLNSILYQETDEIFNEFVQTLEPLQHKKEIYCSALKPSQNVTIFRSPHICAGNVIVATNKVHKEFTEWFNLSRGILVVTPWEWDIMERGNGLDFDSDSALIVLDETIYTRALEVQNFATPILMDKKYEDKYGLKAIVPNPKPRYNTPDDLADLDDIISVNKIGEICNLAQVLNSYYWNEYYKDDADKNYLDAVYEQINILAILSNIEIDKAKHVFDLDMEDILKDIKDKKIGDKPIIGLEKIECEKQFGQKKMKEIYEQQMLCIELSNALENMSVADENYQYSYDELKEENKILDELKNETSEKVRPVRPYFLQFRQDGQYVWSKEINCPMNYIVDEIEKNPLKPDHKTSKIKFYNYIDEIKYDKTKGIYRTKMKMYDIIMEFVKLKNDIDSDYKRNKDNDWKRYNNLDEETLIKLDELTISPETMISFIYMIYAEKENREKGKRKMKEGKTKRIYDKINPELYENRLAIMGILNKGYWEVIKKCLKLQAGFRSELVQDDNGTINLWGIKYLEVLKDSRENE